MFANFRKSLWKSFCQSLLFLTGWKVQYDPEYKDHPRQVVVYPHTSGWELVLAIIVRYAENLDETKIIVWNGQFVGPMGWFLKWLGIVPIENKKSTGAVTNISNYLNTHEKFKFCISPEGSRSFRETFRSGFYYIAKNTHAIYTIVLFDYEKHIMRFYKSLQPSNNFQLDCLRIADEFSHGVHLYPNCGNYSCAPHTFTTMIDWISLSSLLAGLPCVWLLWNYHHPWFSLLALGSTISAFLYHHSKEKEYRYADWIFPIIYGISSFLYRWYITGIIWKFFMLVTIFILIFTQAGPNKRYKNIHYHNWHILHHLALIPITALDIWVH